MKEKLIGRWRKENPIVGYQISETGYLQKRVPSGWSNRCRHGIELRTCLPCREVKNRTTSKRSNQNNPSEPITTQETFEEPHQNNRLERQFNFKPYSSS